MMTIIRRMIAASLTCLLTLPALAKPAPPVADAAVASLSVGVFCALQTMDKLPAPGTLSGWIHVPDGEISFHWPDRQVVPATLGIAFGVKARLNPGVAAPFAEMRVYRPGLATPEIWATSMGDLGDSVAFFRFDTPEELAPGIWRFEAWDGATELYQVEFEVVPAAALPDIAEACGALS
jgi:Domain of unknown function (DUF3859)